MICNLCPRMCGVDRERGRAFCGAGNSVRVARAGLHLWEEPPLVTGAGSGAVFFSHCPLRCVYCQNYKISAEGFGEDISEDELSAVFLRLQALGASNINLVSPTAYIPHIIRALGACRDRLSLPIVINSSGYERHQTVRALEGFAHIYLTDYKYVSPELSERYSACADYAKFADEAVGEMLRQQPNVVYDENGAMKRGVILRHLVLPSHKDESIRVLRHIAERFTTKGFLLSLMRQYYPAHRARLYRGLDRRLTTYEYECVAQCAAELGYSGFFQEKEASAHEYTPPFDLSGIST